MSKIIRRVTVLTLSVLNITATKLVEQQSCDGWGEGAQRPVLRVNEPHNAVVRNAQARSAAKNH